MVATQWRNFIQRHWVLSLTLLAVASSILSASLFLALTESPEDINKVAIKSVIENAELGQKLGVFTFRPVSTEFDGDDRFTSTFFAEGKKGKGRVFVSLYKAGGQWSASGLMFVEGDMPVPLVVDPENCPPKDEKK